LSEYFIPEVPKLQSAAFIAPYRKRSTNWPTAPSTPTQDITEAPVDAGQPTVIESESNDDDQLFDEENQSETATVSHDKSTSSAQHNQVKIKEDMLKEGEAAPQHDASQAHDRWVPYDVMLGSTGHSPQYGILGEISGRRIALDLNQTHTISLFGVQGGGKSYTLGTIIEMATIAIENLNVLPSPLATVLFHYSTTQDYSPEFTSMIRPNSVEEEIAILRDRFAGMPQALKDILILTPTAKVEERREEYPNIEVRPIAFASSELQAVHWKFLMGAIGSQSMYMRQINHIMRRLRDNLSLDAIENAINHSGLSDHLKELALTRLQFAGEYIDDNQRLRELIHPGRLIVVDLRDEYIEKDEALGLFVVMLQILSEATFNGKRYNKLVVFDEAHKYIESDDLVSGLVEVVREMRHKGTSIMVASQDPPSVPISLIELSTQIIMHKFNSPAWLKHIQKANAALGELTSDKMSHLEAGEAYVWSSKANDELFSRSVIRIKCRPRVTQHGGSTKTAV
jgi:hypothetical protein